MKNITFIALMVLCFLTLVPSVASATNQTDARSAIASAQNVLINCYNAAKASEAAGANITGLQVSLNAAGASLSNAELAYSNGDYNSAVNYANQCQSILSNFVPEANTLKASGEQLQMQSLVIFAGSIAGVLIIVGAGYVVWLKIKENCRN